MIDLNIEFSGGGNMGKTISIGAQSFEYIRKNDYFFIDKSDLIREWWESGDTVTLITRPRRFGKTLNLDMLNCFFSKAYEERDDLFEGLSIWEDEKYQQLQGTYPVIFLSFADIKGNTFEKTKQGIKYALEKLYGAHKYVCAGSEMDEKDLKFFDSVTHDMPDAAAVLALKYLSDYLCRYYRQKILIFLDEYDTPLQEAYVHGYWRELVEITRVSKESIFSDLNNLEVVTTTSDKYAACFGFTEEEVFESLEEFGRPEEKGLVKSWYDGFTFGNKRDIYNPWSIINYLDKKKVRAYWANSSSNGLVNLLIRQGNVQTKIIMEELLRGGFLKTEIDEEIIFDQLQKKKGAVWSLLLASGYLKVVETHFSAQTGRYTYCLALTNREVQLMFEDMIRDWFADEDVPYNNFIKALLLHDVEAMNEFMNEIALATVSSFDIANSVAKNDAPERFYHGFVLGLMVELADRFEITSNRESGFGRYDIQLVPLDPVALDPVIIEFKVRKPLKEASLEETVAAALKQIRDKNYDAALIGRGFEQERIRHYGFAFEGKQVLIGEES